MIESPFLTDTDPNKAVTGSRDPLGLQTIWARFGRRLVGNLTTISTSVRDFTTTILGYYFAERVADIGGCDDGDLGVFLRWEQLAAYARGGVNNDWSFRGVERARSFWNENDSVRLHAGPAGQILSKQKTYGLWGLYTVPARSSGLLEGEPTRITSYAKMQLIERCYLPIFGNEGNRNADAIVQLLSKARGASMKKDASVLPAVAKVLAPKIRSAERDVYRDMILFGGPGDRTDGHQRVLAEAVESTTSDGGWKMSAPRLRDLAKGCRRSGDTGEAVAANLERIVTAESLLAPSAALLGHVLASDGQLVEEVAAQVRSRWGRRIRSIDVSETERLEPDLRDSSESKVTGERWVATARCLASGDYAGAIRCLVDQNAFVMSVRAGGSAWVEEDAGRIRVRMRDDGGTRLPTEEELPTFWRHSYFIDSLRQIALSLRRSS